MAVQRREFILCEKSPLIFQARKAQDGEMSEQEIKAIAS